MTTGQDSSSIEACLDRLKKNSPALLDLLPYRSLEEKLIGLVLLGPPANIEQEATACLSELARSIKGVVVDDLKVVVLGGGTGLSNIVGGDSRNPGWPTAPFQGLKESFAKTRSIVCITDDGGSTGELLKDLPLVALGDIRHVLLSSIQKRKLQKQYGLNNNDTNKTARVLHSLFNYRYKEKPLSSTALLASAAVDLNLLPRAMRESLERLIAALFLNDTLAGLLQRPNCLGNLLLAASILLHAENKDSPASKESATREDIPPAAVINGLQYLTAVLGAEPLAVMPCTTTPARLQVLYSNGAMVTGEYKSGHANRGYPVDRVFVEFVREPFVLPEVMASIREADIIILAPGSLFTSIVPILQVPGLAGEIRNNSRALKILVANLWVQKGETDLVRDEPKRRFYVSDLITAYQRNIPEGVAGLCKHVLTLGLRDIPGSILQSYAMEGKVPIFLDRSRVEEMGFLPIEAELHSKTALRERMVIQHAPDSLAVAIKTLWAIRDFSTAAEEKNKPVAGSLPPTFAMEQILIREGNELPCQKYAAIKRFIFEKTTIKGPVGDSTDEILLRERLAEIIWRHQDILVSHFDNIKGFVLIDRGAWKRNQKWDKVFSFFDPGNGLINIRQDIFEQPDRLEIALLVALGQGVLGRYVAKKEMLPVDQDDETLGRVFRITLYPPEKRCSFFSAAELDIYLRLTRMVRSERQELVYTRLINGNEGFTPPGLMFGLFYAWYLDNRFASHIEYKMSVMRNEVTDLVPEQAKIFSYRLALIDFFREVVFRHKASV